MSVLFLLLIQMFESCIVHLLLFIFLNSFRTNYDFLNSKKSWACKQVLNNNLPHDKQRGDLILILS